MPFPIRPVLFVAVWAVWLVPFILFRPRDREKAVRVKPVARFGIGLQSVAYFLIYLHTPQEWIEPLSLWLIVAGAIAGALACLTAWQAVRALGKQWRIDAGLNADHQLIRTGPYRIVRHPIYASMLCMMLASICWFGTMPLWPVALAFFVAGIEIRVRVEDGLLRERFGAEFTVWTQSTPAYIPFVR